MKQILAILLIMKCISASPTPIVLWHGMGDTCCFPFSLGLIKANLEKDLPGVYVYSVKIGNSTLEDLENGYFMNPNKQVQMICDRLAADKNLTNGFNAIGFSQGSQFLRAVVQRCGHKLPPIKNLITFGGQHQGVYGLPHCGSLKHKTCNYIRKLLSFAAYYEWVQDALVQATYWHDPMEEEKYKQGSVFLAEINNERTINQTYIDNLNSLERFVMVKFEYDTMVQPEETEWFGYYEPGRSVEVLPLQKTELYLQDRLGLKKMNEAGKLVFLSIANDHMRISKPWFDEYILKPYLAAPSKNDSIESNTAKTPLTT